MEIERSTKRNDFGRGDEQREEGGLTEGKDNTCDLQDPFKWS